jgi:diaminohydroxyphosphoribosylaminopyrimidine deaminase/5-amino-6-(5-phosphoribosylamino)uracil reductase
MADNPSLNVRYEELGLAAQEVPERALRQPLRVLLDGRNQLPSDLSCLQPIEPNTGHGQSFGPVLLINSQNNNQTFAEHVSQWQAPYLHNRLDLGAVMDKLGELQVNSVWVEAGAKLAGALLENKLVDELILYQAPKLIGTAGQDLFATKAISQMQDITELVWTDIRQIGPDIKMTALIK